MLAKKCVLRLLFVVLMFVGLLFSSVSFADTAEGGGVNESAEVLSTFIEADRGELIDSFDERREQHKILFFMGVILLVFILLTAGFGVSMAMLGKEVFVPHMICAGVSVFLSIAHAVVAIVWFFPF